MMEEWSSADEGWLDYRAAGGELPAEAYRALLASVGSSSVRETLLVSDHWTNDKHRLLPLLVRPTERELARLCADYEPCAGEDAPEALYGWVAEHLNASEAGHRALMVFGMAAYLFASPGYKGKALYRFWLRNKPKVSEDFRDSVARLSRVPQGLWEVVSRDGDQVQLQDRVGLGLKYHPVGAVSFHNVDLIVGQSVLARVVPTGEGWVGIHGVVLPSRPPESAIRAKVLDLLCKTRIHYRAATIEDVLRWRGHAFHRWCVESVFVKENAYPYCGTLVS